MSTAETYIATVYGRGAMTKAHPTMREAFQWVKDCVHRGDWSYTRGQIKRGDDLLCHYDDRTTLWFDDGYARWEMDR